MLCNFKRRFFHHSPRQEQQPDLSQNEPEVDAPNSDSPEWRNDPIGRQNAMAETVYVPGCTCVFCVMRSETDNAAEHICTIPRSDSHCHARRSLPSFRSVMEVLYPTSYQGASSLSPFSDPPSYTRGDSVAYPARGVNLEDSPLISLTTTSIEEIPLPCGLPDHLAQDPSLAEVPSHWSPSRRVLLVEPNSPVIDLDNDVSEEPLPVYSRFDQRRLHFSYASDILGPYPPLSVLRRSAQ